MYRYNTSVATTPTGAAGRRSTRSARGSAKRRRGEGSGSRGGAGGGLKHKFERAAERPARKWVKVLRPPAANIRFKVVKWIPYEEMTEEERVDYESKQEKEMEVTRPQKSSAVVETNNEIIAEAGWKAENGERAEQDQVVLGSAVQTEISPFAENVDMATTGVGQEKKRPIDATEAALTPEPSVKRVRIEEPPVERAIGNDDIATAVPSTHPIQTVNEPVTPQVDLLPPEEPWNQPTAWDQNS